MEVSSHSVFDNEQVLTLLLQPNEGHISTSTNKDSIRTDRPTYLSDCIEICISPSCYNSSMSTFD
jgi:hypothetical protein